MAAGDFLDLETAEDFTEWMQACSFEIKDAAFHLDLPMPLVTLYQRGEVKIPLSVKLRCQNLFTTLADKKNRQDRWKASASF